jgi:ATP-dependent Zn protease
LRDVEAGAIAAVTTQDDAVIAQRRDGARHIVFVPRGVMPDTIRTLRENDVEIRAERPLTGPTLGDILLGLLPIVLLIGAGFLFLRQPWAKSERGGGPGAAG